MIWKFLIIFLSVCTIYWANTDQESNLPITKILGNILGIFCLIYALWTLRIYYAID